MQRLLIVYMPESKKKNRYKHSEGKRWVEVRVKSSQQLFDARDPAPFRERDLDENFVEYILASVKEFALSVPLKIVIYIEESESKNLGKELISEAIRSYFIYKIDLQTAELKNFIKRAQFFLVIGFIVLGLCIALAQSLSVPPPAGLIGILREGVVIFGWVSIWKPIELILFDWYPHWETIRFYKKLIVTEIDIRFTKVIPD